ncbi:Fmp52p [Sugiyamaella lignohabitans]|uniref:Fmp52p n=1 Tax=Sugiyamaella lignohabitans TaxID=796027 RepID=A0A167D4A7_9ASCO|nr:Fmp52p [Sugiyamaella lignohabitans]ANB12461.1 Fmp52p [Sugiyamaella lignohabitans]
MAPSSLNVIVLGATGLVGKLFVKESAESKASFISSVKTIGRRSTGVESAKVSDILDPDTSKWPDKIAELESTPDVMFSGLGTTKAIAGSFENQYKIDHDLNVAAAKAAKEKGVKTYVLISSAGSSAGSMIPYLKMKGEIERDIIALEFPRTIILRPGVLIGEREVSHGIGEVVMQKFTSLVYGTVFTKISPMSAAKGVDVARSALELLKTDPPTDSSKPAVEIYENSKILDLAKSYSH